MGKAKKAKEAALKSAGQDDTALWEAVKATARPVRRDTIFRDSRIGTEPDQPPAARVKKSRKPALSPLLPPDVASAPILGVAVSPPDVARGVLTAVAIMTGPYVIGGILYILASLNAKATSQ